LTFVLIFDIFIFENNHILLIMPSETQILNNYVSILEKTNQQLSLWYNPYGVAIGILTLLIAVIAIVVAYALWRHSKEQRDRINQFFIEQEKIIKEKNENVEKVEAKLNELIKEYEKQLKDTKTRNKKEIQKIIDDLKKEKASIGSYIVGRSAYEPMNISPAGTARMFGLNQSLFSGLGERSTICTKCGKEFSYQSDRLGDRLGEGVNIYSIGVSHALGGENVYCPYCGTKNIVQ